MTLPSDYDVGISRIEAYIYSGKVLPKSIDFACDCLTKVSELDWISFDSSLSTFAIYTSSSQIVGKHTVLLVQSFDNFQSVNPYTAFSILVFSVNQPPYFEKELVTQKVEQCPGLN